MAAAAAGPRRQAAALAAATKNCFVTSENHMYAWILLLLLPTNAQVCRLSIPDSGGASLRPEAFNSPAISTVSLDTDATACTGEWRAHPWEGSDAGSQPNAP